MILYDERFQPMAHVDAYRREQSLKRQAAYRLDTERALRRKYGW